DKAGVNVVGVEFNNADPAKAKGIVSDYIQRFPDLAGVWLDAGFASVATVEAFQDAGKKVVPVTGEDQQDFLNLGKQHGLTGSGRPAGDRLTIRDVARDAEVSVATVSRVLAGSASVSPALADRVRDAVQRLGYTPHSVARSLASGRTRLVGVLVPNLANHYFYALIKRMLHDAERDGYRLIVADSDENVVAERELGDNLLNQTDGLILCSPRSRASVLRQFVEQGKIGRASCRERG